MLLVKINVHDKLATLNFKPETYIKITSGGMVVGSVWPRQMFRYREAMVK